MRMETTVTDIDLDRADRHRAQHSTRASTS